MGELLACGRWPHNVNVRVNHEPELSGVLCPMDDVSERKESGRMKQNRTDPAQRVS